MHLLLWAAYACARTHPRCAVISLMDGQVPVSASLVWLFFQFRITQVLHIFVLHHHHVLSKLDPISYISTICIKIKGSIVQAVQEYIIIENVIFLTDLLQL